MNKGGKKKNNRGMVMGMAFVFGMILVALEIWLVFRRQWDLAAVVMAENPLFFIAVFGSQMGLPVAVAMLAGSKTGKRIGDEAEMMARSLRP